MREIVISLIFLLEGFMGRKKVNEEDLKVNITIRLPVKIIQKLRNIEGYNGLIEKLLTNYFNGKK